MGTREFTDQSERTRRRKLVRRIGDAAFGQRLGRESDEAGHKGTWHAEMALAIEAATGRALGRARVAQWLLTTDDAKPVPAWVLDALPAIARTAAADLRERAARLDVLEAESGAPPASQSEPESDSEPATPRESGSSAAATADVDDFDVDAFVGDVLAAGPGGRIEGAMELPVVETRVGYVSGHGWIRQPAHPLGR